VQRISCDTETTGSDFQHSSKPYFITIAEEDGTQYFWEADVDPVTREPDWDREDLADVEKRLREADEVVFQNPNFDVRALITIIPSLKDWDWSKTRCTLLADHLICSSRRHDLTTQALVYLGVDIQPFEDRVEKATQDARRFCRSKLKDWLIAKKGNPDMPSLTEEAWKADMWLLRAVAKNENYAEDHPWWTLLADYANTDSAVTLPIYLEQMKLLESRGLWKIYVERLKTLKHRYSLETVGLPVNEARMNELKKKYTEESKAAGEICNNIAESYNGYQLILPKNGLNKNLTTFMFDEMKLPVVKTTDKGAPSFDKFALDTYMSTLPERGKELTFIKALKGKRSRDTALGFMESYRRYWLKLKGSWRVLYPSLNATGTRTLRWSSKGPNEQQISKKEDFNLRYMFGPLPGREWWSLDYQNIELRIPAYESNERVMIDLFEKPDEPPYFGSNHLFSASVVYPEVFWPIADQKGLFKKKYASTYYGWIKGFNFALQYGAIEKSGTADRAARRKGAQAAVQKRLKEASRLNQHYIDMANRLGYVETIPDSEICPERGYPLYCEKNKYGKVLETVPLNYHVQGTACWVMMRAMDKVQDYLDQVNAECPGHAMVLQVHDELIFDFPQRANMGNLPKIRKIKRIMEEMGTFINVPLTVGVEYHPDNWSEGVAIH